VERLVGLRLPDVELPASDGSAVNPSRLEGRAVLFCYPWTGRPGHPDPPGWDELPGAHGSTPQALAYSRAYGEFHKRNVRLFGVSLQEAEWQDEFARRNALPFPLLSDAERRFSQALALPAFTTGGADFLKRLTLIARDAVITAVRFPVRVPGKDAAEVLATMAETCVSRV
jgi:peroxiredoxin